MSDNDKQIPPLELNAEQTALLENILTDHGRSPAYAHAPTMRELIARHFAATADAGHPDQWRLEKAVKSAFLELHAAQMEWSMLDISVLKTISDEVKALDAEHPEWKARYAEKEQQLRHIPSADQTTPIPSIKEVVERTTPPSPIQRQRPTPSNKREPLFRQITADERRENLIIWLTGVTVIGLILGLAAVSYFVFDCKEASMGIGAGGCGVATLQLVRVTRRWNRRFAVRFNVWRLFVCLTLLFSSAAYQAARGIVTGVCLLAGNESLYTPTAITGMILCTIAALTLKYAINHLPSEHFHRAPWMGWGISLLLTMTMGFFLSMAIQK